MPETPEEKQTVKHLFVVSPDQCTNTIFNNSRIKAKMENEEHGNSVLVGDSQQNESQIRTRIPIDRVFGVLKRWFPVLANGIRLKVEKVETIIISCAILHNIA
ncbi:hypothetical protein NQ314_014193 [Rhamnusium bicolor]|uniref:DDE Tnp4 domain-containing protein n=1 Tax=Rhamnusium bicolor TaxID=1586634 RepID=A0AAV8X3P0_9CUCU|nr:hypothetical protein NQ314_014193 [Rhamnusium bicolor]